MKEFVVKILAEIQIPLQNCRCLNFDGAANMSGSVSGLQTRIRRLAHRAVFFHCAAHRLNLVVVAACHCIKKAANFFGLVQSVYNCIACAPTRRQLYENGWKEHIPGNHVQTLKKLCEIRWGCQRRALRVLYEGFPAILYALQNFLVSATDAKTRAEANGLLKQLEHFDFIFNMHLFRPLL